MAGEDRPQDTVTAPQRTRRRRRRVRVLAVDEWNLTRQALRVLFDTCDCLRVVSEAEGIEHVLQALEESTVDVVVTILRPPHFAALGLTRAVKARHPRVKVAVIASINAQDQPRRAGADAVISADAPIERLLAQVCALRTHRPVNAAGGAG